MKSIPQLCLHLWLQWFAILGIGLLIQSTGCWCQPAPVEHFNEFPPGSPGTANEFCGVWAAAECSYIDRCRPALKQALGEEGGCIPFMTDHCERKHGRFRAIEQLDHATYDPHLARSCIDSTARRACGVSQPKTCQWVFHGVLKERDPCRDSSECATGLICAIHGGCGACFSSVASERTRMCRPHPSCSEELLCNQMLCGGAVPGSTCSSSFSCEEGSECVMLGSTWQCVKPGVQSASCAVIPCADGYTCVNTASGPTCAPDALLEGNCDPNGLTAPRCQEQGIRLACDGATQRCVPVRVVSLGGTCDGNLDICQSNLHCAQGVCETRPRAGQSCQMDTKDPCWASHCLHETCVVLGRVGESCDGTCLGMDCVNNVCGSYPCSFGTVWDAGILDSGTGELDAGVIHG